MLLLKSIKATIPYIAMIAARKMINVRRGCGRFLFDLGLATESVALCCFGLDCFGFDDAGDRLAEHGHGGFR